MIPTGTADSRALRRGAVALLAASAAISLAACSSSGKSGGGTSTTGTTSATTTTTTSTTASSTGTASTPAAGGDASLFPDKPATGSEVKIGLINPEGGQTVSQPDTSKAARAAADYANANLGGLAGHKIVIDFCADAEDGASNTKCANQMVEDKVAAVVVTTSGNGDSMVPIITKAGIPYVSVSGASGSELTSPNAFMWTGGFPATLAAMAKYSAEQQYKSVAAFITGVPTAVGGATQIGKPAFGAAKIGFDIVPVTPGVADATPQVRSGLGKKPDAAILVFDAAGCAATLKALGTVDPSLPKLLITPCLDPATVQAVGQFMEGAKVFGVQDPDGTDPEATLYQAVMKKYAPDASPEGYSAVGYQGMLGLIRATQSITGDVTSASIIAAIKAAKNIPLPAGNGLTFTCDGKQLPGLTSVCASANIVLTVKGGKGTDPQNVKLS
jgi:branched-chain amino acid transport system substrate-binding protein